MGNARRKGSDGRRWRRRRGRASMGRRSTQMGWPSSNRRRQRGRRRRGHGRQGRGQRADVGRVLGHGRHGRRRDAAGWKADWDGRAAGGVEHADGASCRRSAAEKAAGSFGSGSGCAGCGWRAGGAGGHSEPASFARQGAALLGRSFAGFFGCFLLLGRVLVVAGGQPVGGR